MARADPVVLRGYIQMKPMPIELLALVLRYAHLAADRLQCAARRIDGTFLALTKTRSRCGLRKVLNSMVAGTEANRRHVIFKTQS